MWKKSFLSPEEAKKLSGTNRWQQRNEPIIYDVTSVKYNKENDIFSY